MHRFYYPGSLSVAEVELTGDEGRHLMRVLRYAVGDRVELFDGRGQAATAEVVSTDKTSATLRLLRMQPVPHVQRPTITLLTASPKSERLRWLVEKATELGVDQITLLKTARSVVHPGAGKLEKMRAVVIAACKQSGRNRLMRINPPQPGDSALENAMSENDRLLIASADGVPLEGQRADVETLSSLAIAIGPEGGWTSDEMARAIDRGATLVQLGPLTLRTETTCLYMMSALRSWIATHE